MIGCSRIYRAMCGVNSSNEVTRWIQGRPSSLEIDVHAFKPGSTAARILVGFGAGRASLIYTARFVSEGGEVLAQIDGQERHTGYETYGFLENRHAFSAFAGADKTREILLSEAARHIVAVLK